jgi:hypothetical protein
MLLGVLARPAAGQRPANPPPGGPADSLEQTRELGTDVRRRIEELRRQRISEALRLDASQTERVEQELGRFRDRQLQLRGERERLLSELQRGLDQRQTSDADLERTLGELRRNQQERDQALVDLKERLAHELTLEQQARLALFAERFQGRMAEGLRRIREHRESLAGRRPWLGRFRGPAQDDSSTTH